MSTTEPIRLTLEEAEARTAATFAALEPLLDEGLSLPPTPEPEGSALKRALRRAQGAIGFERAPRPVDWKLTPKLVAQRLDYAEELLRDLQAAIADAKAAQPPAPDIPEEARTLAEQERALDARLRDALARQNEPGAAGVKARRMIEELEAEIHDCRALRGEVLRTHHQHGLAELRQRRDAARERHAALEQRVNGLVKELAELTHFHYTATAPVLGGPSTHASMLAFMEADELDRQVKERENAPLFPAGEIRVRPIRGRDTKDSAYEAAFWAAYEAAVDAGEIPPPRAQLRALFAEGLPTRWHLVWRDGGEIDHRKSF